MDFIAPWDLFESKSGWIKNMSDPWRPNAFELYVKINANTTFEVASAKIKNEKLKHLNSELAKKKPELFLWPMKQWHLYSEFKEGYNIGGRIQYVWMFGIIGGFVLLLACINFMNLCTARSERRAKEIGIRKSIGSVRAQLIQQFFSESFLMAFMSLAVALVIAWLSIPFFNEIASKNIMLPWDNSFFWMACISFCFITALIAGSYPALYLSSFQVVNVLKGTFRAAGGTTTFRRVLVVIQFSVSVTLIIGTLVVFQQIQFAKNRPMGYNSSGLISVSMMNDVIHRQYDAVQNEVLSSGMIVSMAESSSMPTHTSYSSSGFVWEGKDPNLSIDFRAQDVSHNYGKTIGWEIVAGRDYDREFLSDSSALLINEAALNFMQLKEPIGATIQWFGRPFHVIGVVRDIITASPYEPVQPTIYDLDPSSTGYINLRMSPTASAHNAIAKVEEIFKKFNPEQPFDYQFVDEEYDRKFGNEERVGRLASTFSALAIFISCLGIFGLAAFVAEQRTKEIGIRKILGASLFSVWKMLSKEFVVLVVISCVLAMPIGYFLLNSWLNGYTYHTNITWWIFGVTFLSVLSITLITVSTQAIKAAFTNPVKSLRSE
jgi:ABC-type antimicrobial peptide transport system permease subunit